MHFLKLSLAAYIKKNKTTKNRLEERTGNEKVPLLSTLVLLEGVQTPQGANDLHSFSVLPL